MTIQEGFAAGMAELRAEASALAEEVRQLTEAHQHTDGRVNALIDVVEDLRRGRRPP